MSIVSYNICFGLYVCAKRNLSIHCDDTFKLVWSSWKRVKYWPNVSTSKTDFTETDHERIRLNHFMAEIESD